jgi:hypothetical protein
MIKNKTGGTLKIGFSIMLTSLFVMSVLVFSTQFAEDNAANITIADSNEFGTASSINGTLQTFYSENNQTIKDLYGSEAQDGTDSLDRLSTFETGNEGGAGAVVNLSKQAASVIFGDATANRYGATIVTAFIGFLFLTIGLYVWKTFKQGDPL